MKLINSDNPNDNWHEALYIWSHVVNWPHYKPSKIKLRSDIKQLIITLWNEKDWLISQHPDKKKEIELFIDNSKYMKVIADLANTAKHRSLTKTRRSIAQQTDYYGKTTINNSVHRHHQYIDMGNGEHVEIMPILRGAIDELSEFRLRLITGAL